MPTKWKRTGRFRSKFESLIARQLAEHGAKWKYEYTVFPYYARTRLGIVCETCGPTNGLLRREYLPDFFLSNGVIIEGKGRLTGSDRAKLRAVAKQHPDLDLRILFQYDGKIDKRTDKRYSDWAEETGIPWAVKTIPDEWLLHSDQLWPKRNWQRLFPSNENILHEVTLKKKRKTKRTEQ